MNIKDDLLEALAMGPSSQVTSWNRYSINGFNFQTLEHGKHKSSMNYGVYISSTHDLDFYGILDEIIELSYYGSKRIYKAILFKCTWMDNSRKGMNEHKLYKIVEVNRKEKYSKNEPFALGHQAHQVYFAPYPSTSNDSRRHWEVVFKTKARSDFNASVDENDVFQEEAISINTTSLSTINIDDIIDDDDINGDDDEELEALDVAENDDEVEGDEEEDDDEEEDEDDDTEEEEDDDDEDCF